MIGYYVKDNGKLFGPIERGKLISFYREGFFSSYAVVSTDQAAWDTIEAVVQTDESIVEKKQNDHPNEAIPKKQPQILRITPHSLVQRKPEYPVQENNSEAVTSVVFTLLLIAFLAAAALGGYWYFYMRDKGEVSAEKLLLHHCQKTEPAIGTVTVVLENKDGVPPNKITDLQITSEYPVGMAFAIYPGEFATTAAVANRLKTVCKNTDDICFYFINMAAAHAGARTRDDFRKFSMENSKQIIKLQNAFSQGVRIGQVNIRTGNGDLFKIDGVKIHPDYAANSKDISSIESDAALLTSSTPSSICIKAAASDDLQKSLKGTAVGTITRNGDKRIGDIVPAAETGKFKNLDKNSKIILHNISVTSECAGAPILLANGSVIAIQSGYSGVGASQVNCALRIDVFQKVKLAAKHNISAWIN